MHPVHTRMRLWVLPTCPRTLFRFTSQRRLVTLWAWLILLPARGPLPQMSQTRAMVLSNSKSWDTGRARSCPAPKPSACQEGLPQEGSGRAAQLIHYKGGADISAIAAGRVAPKGAWMFLQCTQHSAPLRVAPCWATLSPSRFAGLNNLAQQRTYQKNAYTKDEF